MSDKMTADQVKALAEGSVDTVRDSFEHMEDAHLTMLLDLEKQGKKRSTAIEAIEHEIERRKAQASGAGVDAEGVGKLEPDPNVRMYTQAELDEAVRNARVGGENAMAQLREDHEKEIAAMREEHAKELGAAQADAEVPENDGGGFAPMALVGGEHPGLYACQNGGDVLFVGEDGRPFRDLPPISFGPSDFVPDGDGAKLTKEVEFPVEVGEALVTAAFLLDDDDDPIGRAEFVQPFSVGGGRKAKIPGGFLTFTR